MVSLFSFAPAKPKNKLPAWKGFNLLDFFSHNPKQGRPTKPEYLNWIADWGFDFVRVPISYPSYLSIDRTRPIRTDEVLNFDESRLEKVDQLVEQSLKQGLHVSLNLHRAPGFCIMRDLWSPIICGKIRRLWMPFARIGRCGRSDIGEFLPRNSALIWSMNHFSEKIQTISTAPEVPWTWRIIIAWRKLHWRLSSW